MIKLPPGTSLDTKIALLREYIEEGPVLYHPYIYSITTELLWDYSDVPRIRNIAAAARDYTEACYALQATTGNLVRHDLEHSDIESLTSAHAQNKQAAWKAYEAALRAYDSYQRNRTGPLEMPPLNW